MCSSAGITSNHSQKRQCDRRFELVACGLTAAELSDQRRSVRFAERSPACNRVENLAPSREVEQQRPRVTVTRLGEDWVRIMRIG